MFSPLSFITPIPTRSFFQSPSHRLSSSSPSPCPCMQSIRPAAFSPDNIPSQPSRSRRSRRRGPSNNHESIHTKAKQLIRAGRTNAASTLLQRGTRDNPRDGRNWVALGRLEAAKGNAKKAREIFRKGHDILDKNAYILHAWARLEVRQGCVEQARILLERALENNPRDAMLFQEYALMEAGAGNLEKARRLFEEGCRKDKGNASVRSAWGTLELRVGDLDKARFLFEEAVKCDHMHIRSYQSWAIAETKAGNVDKAEALYKQALRLDPKSTPSYQAYGLLCKDLGRIDEARALFKQGLQNGKGDVSILHAWAALEHELGNNDRARALYSRGLEVAPQSTAVLRAWASMELELGHIDKSSDWQVPRGLAKGAVQSGANGQRHKDGSQHVGTYRKKQISAVGENLLMLKRLIERRTEEDVSLVLQWLAERAEKDSALRDQVAKRGGEDASKVIAWAERRTKEDIGKFDQWVATRYKEDRKIGVYIFNMDIPDSPPREWFRLRQTPERELQNFDDSLYSSEQVVDYADFVYWVGKFANGLSNRAALAVALGVMSFLLVGANMEFENQGYSSSVGVSSDQVEVIAKPTGVDAHLVQQHFGSNEFLNLGR